VDVVAWPLVWSTGVPGRCSLTSLPIVVPPSAWRPSFVPISASSATKTNRRGVFWRRSKARDSLIQRLSRDTSSLYLGAQRLSLLTTSQYLKENWPGSRRDRSKELCRSVCATANVGCWALIGRRASSARCPLSGIADIRRRPRIYASLRAIIPAGCRRSGSLRPSAVFLP
jgi:hypothetical protein